MGVIWGIMEKKMETTIMSDNIAQGLGFMHFSYSAGGHQVGGEKCSAGIERGCFHQ